MSAHIIELAAYRAQQAPKPAAARPTSLRASADSAAAALAAMAAACRASAENLQLISVGAHKIAAQAGRMRDDIQTLHTQSGAVNDACASLSNLELRGRLAAG